MTRFARATIDDGKGGRYTDGILKCLRGLTGYRQVQAAAKCGSRAPPRRRSYCLTSTEPFLLGWSAQL